MIKEVEQKKQRKVIQMEGNASLVFEKQKEIKLSPGIIALVAIVVIIILL